MDILSGLDELLLNIHPRYIVSQGYVCRDYRSGGTDDRYGMSNDVQIGQSRQIAVLGLNLGMKKPAFGNPPEVFLDTNEISNLEVPQHAKHDPGHHVAEKGGRRECDRCTQHYPDQAKDLAAQAVFDRKKNNDAEQTGHQ